MGQDKAELKILSDDAVFTSPWRSYTNWGWALYRQGDEPGARSKLERAEHFNPRYWPMKMNLGILEAEQGRRPEAIELFSEALQLEPGALDRGLTFQRPPDQRLDLGFVRRRAGDADELVQGVAGIRNDG